MMKEKRKQGRISKMSDKAFALMRSKHHGKPHCTYEVQATAVKCENDPRWKVISYRQTSEGKLEPIDGYFCDEHARQFCEQEDLNFPG